MNRVHLPQVCCYFALSLYLCRFFIDSINFFSFDQTAKPQCTVPNSTSKLKMDPDVADILLKANDGYKNFKKLNQYTITVRPWFLHDYAKKLNINDITQFALYKCMHDVCLFACDSQENWKIHMEQHLNLIDVLAAEKKLKREYRAELVKFRECSYCGREPNEKCPRIDEVCRHMEMEHRRNAFQCSHCFYRAMEMDNMVLHMEKYHGDSDREILLYDVQHRKFEDSDKDELNQCHQKITKITCNLGKCFRMIISNL